MIYNLVVCIDNDDYGIAFPAGSHIDVVFLVRPTHYVPESVVPCFDGIFFRVSVLQRRVGENEIVKLRVLRTNVKP